MFLNAQSVRNKALDICDYIMQANVDLVFLCETWLRPVGDEADCAALTPPGFLFEISSPTVWWACCFASNQSYKTYCSFYLRFCFYGF